MTARACKPILCDRAAYDALEGINWSTLKYAVTSALDYQYHLDAPKMDSDAMKLGRAVHTAVFEPDALLGQYVLWEGGRRVGPEWDKFVAANVGRTILLPDEWTKACAIRDAVRSHPLGRKVLAKGMAECTITWTDKATGLKAKARLDWLAPRTMVDLKTTRNIEARAFGRQMADTLVHSQLAFYHEGLLANGMKRRVKILAVENEPPYDLALYTLDDDMLWAGEEKVHAALELVASCRKSRRWPGRYQKEQLLMLPPWCFPKDENEFSLAELGLVPKGATL